MSHASAMLEEAKEVQSLVFVPFYTRGVQHSGKTTLRALERGLLGCYIMQKWLRKKNVFRKPGKCNIPGAYYRLLNIHIA